MTAQYQQSDLHFLYPENWTICDEQMDQDPRSVTVQSPATGFWAVHVYEGVDESLERLSQAVLESMRDEYAGLESRSVREEIAAFDLVGFDMDFSCLDMIIAASVRSFRDERRTYVAIWQAEEREFQRLSAVFLAITTSLLQQSPDGDAHPA